MIPPHSFLQSPRRWLQAISKYRATVSGAPENPWTLDGVPVTGSVGGVPPLCTANLGNIAEMRMIFFAIGSRDPAVVAIGISIEFPITEIAPQQSKLPHVISDVFADVANRAVGADDNFLVLLCDLFLCVPGVPGG